MLLVFVLGDDGALVARPASAGSDEEEALGGTSGTLSHVLCNGTLCVRSMSLKDAGSSEKSGANATIERILVFHATVSNESRSENRGFFDVTLAGSDGVTFAGRALDRGWTLEPGRTGCAIYGFSVPSDFVPSALVLGEPAHPSSPAFRIAIQPNDWS